MNNKFGILFFLFLINFSLAQSTEPNDCINAITVCDNEIFQSDGSGIGGYSEVSSCGGFEHNSIWIKVPISQTGKLAFDLIPDDPNILVDYDFWVYGPNVSCNSLGSPIRCATTNPQLANQSNNFTGLSITTSATSVGPGANGDSYARWLDVKAGEVYYIAIDRAEPYESKFTLVWNGDAKVGAGIPPTASPVPDLRACSITPGTGIFDLNQQIPGINSNSGPTQDPSYAYVTTFYGSLSDAITQKNDYWTDLNSISVTGTKTIWARVTDPVTGCFAKTDFDVFVDESPVVALSVSSNAICSGENVTVTFTGTPSSVISYNDGGATKTAILNNAGVFSFAETLSSSKTYTLEKAETLDSLGNVTCTNNNISIATVTVLPLPTVNLSSNQTICSGSTASITFTGTANAIVNYTNDGVPSSCTLDGSGNYVLTFASLSANKTITLTDVSLPGALACKQPALGTATITVVPLPTASISGTSTICEGDTAIVTFNGTPNAIVTYTLNANPPSTITLDNLGKNTITTTVTGTYTLSSVSQPGTPACPQSLSGSAIVTVIPMPTASISGSTSICSGNTATITFTGTPNTDVTYLDNLGNTQAIALNGLGNATLVTPPLANSATYTLVSVSTQGVPTCVKTLTGSVTITVSNPAATISGTTTICAGNTATITFTGSPNNAVVSYHIGANPIQTIPLVGGVATVTTPVLASGPVVYTLDSVLDPASGCSNPLIGNATITVVSIPVINTPSNYVICDDYSNDGKGYFNLQSIDSQITSNPALTVSYYETSTSSFPIDKTQPYFSIGSNTIYVKVYDPSAPQCPAETSFQLIINPAPVQKTNISDYQLCDYNNPGDGMEVFNLNTKNSAILSGLSNVAVTYYSTQTDAQNKTNQLPVIYNSASTTVWFRIENTITGCEFISSFKLIVNPLPNATQPSYAPYVLCDYNAPGDGKETFDLNSKIPSILLGQTGMSVSFYLYQADADSKTVPPLPLSYTNTTANSQVIWIRIENNTTKCYTLSSMELRVEPLPNIIAPSAPYTLCDTDQDGKTSFDLSTLTAGIQNGGNYTITYHASQNDTTPLSLNYTNTTPFSQIIYAYAEDNVTGCRSVVPVNLVVELPPVINSPLPNLTLCDEDTNPQDGITQFDLTQIEAIAVSNPANYTISYYTSQNDAQTGSAAIVQPTQHLGTNNQIIWIRVNSKVTPCFAISSFTLIVNKPLALIPPSPLNVCDADASPNNQFATFDLTVKTSEISQNQPGAIVTYYPSSPVTGASIPIATPSAYPNTTPAVQTLGVKVTNAQGCRSYTTLDIRVLPIPVPNSNPPALAAKCDDNNPGDMKEVFDLTTNAALIKNNDPSLVLHYYPTQTDALALTNEILTPSAALVGQNVWIRVENGRIDYQNQSCFVLVEQALRVNPLPTVVQPLTIEHCDDDTDGVSVFNLTTEVDILGSTQPKTKFTVSYYTTALDAQNGTNAIANPSAYQNSPNNNNPQTIYVRVVNNTTGCVNATGKITIVVNPIPLATSQSFATCDYDGYNDGYYTLDLSSYINSIIGTQIGLDVTFYETQADADAANNSITEFYNYQAYTHTVWIRVTNTSTGCYEVVPFDLEVERLAEPAITSPSNTICVEFGTDIQLNGLTLDSNVTDPNYTFEWFLDGNDIPGALSSTYDVDTIAPGDYTTRATSTSSLGCISDVSYPFEVIKSGPPVFDTPSYTVTNAFAENPTITVFVNGYGQYEYSMDGGEFQSSNIFEGVTLGSHSIVIRDAKGNTSCGQLEINDIPTINYPHYFSPNGDGIHDTWNIVGLENQPASRLYIFDRYGKLLKQLSTTGNGWDGTFNGERLPATDYWFRIEYQENSIWKEFKSHFSLMR